MREFRDHLQEGLAWREWPGEGGEAPVLVCLHGIGSRGFGWARLAEALPGWRLIAWDAPGYGLSAPLESPEPVAADYAKALVRLVNLLELRRFSLVGHSLGTLMAAAYARNYPQGLEGLTLVSCAEGGGTAPGEALSEAHRARINDLQELGAEEFSSRRAARLICQADENPDLVALVRAAMATMTLPGYAQAVQMLAQGKLAEDCAAVSTLTDVVCGAADVVTPPAQSRRAFAALPVPRGLTVIPGCGHAVPLQAPEALADVIRAQRVCAPQGAPR